MLCYLPDRCRGCPSTAQSCQGVPSAALTLIQAEFCRYQVRHPNILTFKDTMELEEKGETVIYLVTEPVTPLATILTELDIEGPARQAVVQLAFGATSDNTRQRSGMI